jgi:hypothetical protein
MDKRYKHAQVKNKGKLINDSLYSADAVAKNFQSSRQPF